MSSIQENVEVEKVVKVVEKSLASDFILQVHFVIRLHDCLSIMYYD